MLRSTGLLGAVLALALLAWAADNAADAGGTGRIAGTLFHDADQDGARDEGEEGLGNRVLRLFSGDVAVDITGTQAAGLYAFEGIQPGEYTLEASLDEVRGGICIEWNSTHNPLVKGCSPTYINRWNSTTPASLVVAVEEGETNVLSFGGVRADTVTINGLALTLDGLAPSGTRVKAIVNGQPCGEAEVGGYYPQRFLLDVLGAGERSGCAEEGDVVGFEVSGVKALQTLIWHHDEGGQAFDLIALPDHAWYWTDFPLPRVEGALGLPVAAVIDGVVCKQTTITDAPPAFSAPLPLGFGPLIVPRETLQAGCGRDGATVRFLVGGVDTGVTVPWAPGVSEVSLPLQVPSPTSTPGPSPAVTPQALPEAGGQPGSGEGWALVALVGVGLVLAAASAVAVTRRRSTP